MPLSNREDYDRALAVVRDTINAWDPYGLIGGGAPDDEWNSEAAKILAEIPSMESDRDAANVVSRVFSASLDRESFSPKNCMTVGAQLFDALIEARVIDST